MQTDKMLHNLVRKTILLRYIYNGTFLEKFRMFDISENYFYCKYSYLLDNL